jgi:hypothetical protein
MMVFQEVGMFRTMLLYLKSIQENKLPNEIEIRLRTGIMNIL